MVAQPARETTSRVVRYLVMSLATLALVACGGDVTRSPEAIDPPAPTIPAIAESERAILQEPDIRLEPTRCPTGVPDGVRWYVTDLGAALEYKGCWTGGPTGDLVVGVLDADGLPPDAEIAGLHAFSGSPNSSGLSSMDGGLPGFPHAHGDPRIAELRGLDSTGTLVAVPAIAGWADLPEMPEIEHSNGALGPPDWVEIATIDANGVILSEYSR